MESSNLGSVPEETLEEQHQQDSSKPVFSAFASRPDRPPTQSSSQKYSPLDWAAYFDREEDVCISDSNDVFHLYMAGKEGPVVFCLHGGGYSGLSFALSAGKIKEKARVVAMDLRGHGKSSTENDLDLSIEGTAMASLIHMQKILSNRMQHFSSIEKAIEWSVRGGSLRNIDSARVSIPTTLSYDDSKQCYVYRARLEETEQYWRGWYEGLSEKFLSCPVPKVLLLAGTDRLDSRALTIGQMQGKFQMVVVRHTGHAIQEDVPDEFATLILNFISRNRIGPHGVEIPGLGWRAQPRS
ncbi:probable protein phosphatase methylesterase 1 isoform X4 [Durio zibethinus]|uniref:Protein phosphatase methylesterase 1 n=1 Tax=Durio zibethinus TaxID=66656 RepID=A0A6P5XYM3_DURZI|nr:probable protein phosphatase methylesterase 1 isoform X4 [Durio zibethinus]